MDDREPVVGREVEVGGRASPAILNEDGMTFFGSDGKKVLWLLYMYVSMYVCTYVCIYVCMLYKCIDLVVKVLCT